MEFIYDGSHYKQDDKQIVSQYDGDVVLWLVYEAHKNENKYVVEIAGQEVVQKNRLIEAESYIEGFMNALKKSLHKEQKEDEQVLPKDVFELQAELKLALLKIEKISAEKEKVKRLSEKLIKGIMKNKIEETEGKIQEILLKHVEDL